MVIWNYVILIIWEYRFVDYLKFYFLWKNVVFRDFCLLFWKLIWVNYIILFFFFLGWVEKICILNIMCIVWVFDNNVVGLGVIIFSFCFIFRLWCCRDLGFFKFEVFIFFVIVLFERVELFSCKGDCEGWFDEWFMNCFCCDKVVKCLWRGCFNEIFVICKVIVVKFFCWE